MQIIKAYIISIILLLGLDTCWIGFLAKKFYLENLGVMIRISDGKISPIWSAAIIVYLLVATGIVFFVLPKASDHPMQALFWGAVFGAICYGIYDFTNYALLNNWTLSVTVVDLCWGIFLCGITSYLTSLIIRVLS